MNFYAKSDKGPVRDTNEDSYAIRMIGETCVMAVADGIGGESAGEIASRIAIEHIMSQIELELIEDIDSMPEETLKECLEAYFQQANYKILSHAVKNPECMGMGTTLTVAAIRKTRVLVAHMGDSRAYLVHGSAITRITSDHTYAQALLDSGSITAEEAKIHEGRHTLQKSLGENAFLHPDFYGYNIIYGDLILLCTDGVHSVLDDKEILNCVRKHNDLEGGADNLIAAASEYGNTDNITVLLTHVKPMKR